jgi:hypothetical protein
MFQPKGDARRKEEPARRVVPTAGDLTAGRDFDWNDRVGMIRALSTGKSIFVPNLGKPFMCDGPVYGFHDNQYIYGVDTGPVMNTRMAYQVSGNATTSRPTIKANFQGGPLVLMASAQNLGTPAAETWVNLAGVLDRSCRPETRYGLRFFGGSQRAIFYSDGFQMGGAAGIGDYWQGKTYTIALAFQPFNGGSTSNRPRFGSHLIGFGNFTGGPEEYPWFLKVVPYPEGSADLYLQFRYRDADDVTHQFFWKYPETHRGVVRLYILIDIDRVRFDSNVVVYMDTGSGARKQAMRNSSRGTKGVPIARAFFFPFSIGYLSCMYNALADPHRPLDDFVLCGLHIENQLTYKDNGSGGLVRADTGEALNDSYAFFTPRSSTAGLLPLTSKGGGLPNEIVAKFDGGTSYGFLIHNINSGAYFGGSGIYNLSLYSQQRRERSHFYGDALAIAQTLGCYIRGCSFAGGTSAIRMWNTGSNQYYMRFADLQVQAGAVVICGHNADAVFDDVEMIVGHEGYGFYFAGSTLRINKLRIPTCHRGVKNHIYMPSMPGSNGPNILDLTDYADDNEGQDWPTDANIRVENGLRVSIRNVNLGHLPLPGPTNPAGSPLLKLGHIGPNIPGAVKGYVELEGVAPYGLSLVGPSLVRVEDPDYSVQLKNAVAFNGIYGYLDDSTGGRCSARIEHFDTGAIPPRLGAFWAGKHEVHSPPLPGQYAEWRCVVSGDYGSAQPPVWTGLYPNVVPGSNSVAAYSMSHVGVAGAPFSNGVLNDSLVDSLMKQLFGRALRRPLVTAEAPLHLALISRYRAARNDKHFQEMDSPCVQEIRVRNHRGITGGSFKLAFQGKTTAAIPIGADSGAVSRALWALPTVGERNVQVENNAYYFGDSSSILITFRGELGNEDQPLITIDRDGLKGKDFSFEVVALAHGGGYRRAPVSFKPASRGIASNAAEIRFPVSTGPWNQSFPVLFWMLTTGAKPATGMKFLAGKLAEPVKIVREGQEGPRFPAGSLAVVHHASVQGGFTHHAADLILDAILRGTSIEPPSTWYVGLSTTPVEPSGAGLHEPAENGYARVAVPNTPDHWIYNPFRLAAGVACNKSLVRFADPAGAWAQGRPLPYWFLADSPRGGTIWARGAFPVPVVVADASSPAPSFAPETFLVMLN